jgi:hypothetical protein
VGIQRRRELPLSARSCPQTDVHGDGFDRHGDPGSTPERREMLGLGEGLPHEIPGSVDHYTWLRIVLASVYAMISHVS